MKTSVEMNKRGKQVLVFFVLSEISIQLVVVHRKVLGVSVSAAFHSADNTMSMVKKTDNVFLVFFNAGPWELDKSFLSSTNNLLLSHIAH